MHYIRDLDLSHAKYETQADNLDSDDEDEQMATGEEGAESNPILLDINIYESIAEKIRKKV